MISTGTVLVILRLQKPTVDRVDTALETKRDDFATLRFLTTLLARVRRHYNLDYSIES